MESRLLPVLGLMLLSAAWADNHYVPCYRDTSLCTQNLRSLLVDEDKFWFGTALSTECPLGPFGPGCFNRNPSAKSIMARLYNASQPSSVPGLQSALGSLELAHVSFSSPEGHYYGCGHTTHTPAINFRLDPMTTTEVNSWSLDHTPSISWDTPPGDDANTLYTVMVWDVGSYFSHALYINAKSGQLDSATAIDTYHGPVNTLPRANVYLFGVFRQTKFLDPGLAAGVFGSILGSNSGSMVASTLLASLSDTITDLVAANVMVVKGDSYSFERQKNNYIINGCPFLFSQSPAFKAVLKELDIMPPMGPKVVSEHYYVEPYLSTLIASLDLEFSMSDDVVVDACCVKSTITQSMYTPDPLGSEPVRAAVVNARPRVSLSPINIMDSFASGNIKGNVYTLMMVDLTQAFIPSDPFMVIHWMVANIKSADVTTGDEIVPYMGPNPLRSTRTYVFLLLKQKNGHIMDTSSFDSFVSNNCPEFIKSRCDPQLKALMQDWNMDEIVGINWIQVEPDAFSRKTAYSVFNAISMFDACDGQPGFEDPCPDMQYCGAGNAAETQYIGSMAAALAFALLSYCLAHKTA